MTSYDCLHSAKATPLSDDIQQGRLVALDLSKAQLLASLSSWGPGGVYYRTKIIIAIKQKLKGGKKLRFGKVERYEPTLKNDHTRNAFGWNFRPHTFRVSPFLQGRLVALDLAKVASWVPSSFCLMATIIFVLPGQKYTPPGPQELELCIIPRWPRDSVNSDLLYLLL